MELDVAQMEALMAVGIEWGMRLLSAIAILIAGWVIGNRLEALINKVKKLDSTIKTFLGGLVKYIIMIMAGITILGQFGVQTASLLAVLGAAGLAIGLALQGTLSNVAAGVMMLVLRPFNVGDVIQFQNITGTVKALGLFGCELATFENVYVFAPNSSIWSSDIYNFTRNTHRRQDILVGISYNDDINKAFAVIQKVLDADTRLITTEEKKPQIMVTNMGDFSINLIVRVWSKTSEYWNVKWDLTKNIKESLDKNGITIPFPTRTVYHADTPNKTKQTKKKTKKKVLNS